MKIIFCDVDGVLNDMHTEVRIGSWDFVDDDKVECLGAIVAATNAMVVISSDWRFLTMGDFHGIARSDRSVLWDALMAKLNEFGIPVVGMTGEYQESRGAEIMEYVQAHPEIDKWVALDDIANLYEAEAHHVWVNPNKGLTSKEVIECIKRLADQ